MPWYGTHHVHFICQPDKEQETVDFYTDVMGFDFQKILDLPDGRRAMFFDDGTYNHIYFWTLRDDTEHEIVDKQQAPFGAKSQFGDAERPYTYQVGIHHLSWGVQTDEELYEIKDHLESHGVECWGPINRSNFAYELYFEDPNGINLEIHTPGPDGGTMGVFETTIEGTKEQKRVEVNQVEEGMVKEGAEDGVVKRHSSSFWWA